ncbi:MAG: hypothetical protein HLUCCA01_10535 [Bacteroidetes bacterium HLUCCA01]|nr:MAG: hypothetical protein HLUCCA01_10535 [Bacteroidetes bacterium HLUCCA01]
MVRPVCDWVHALNNGNIEVEADVFKYAENLSDFLFNSCPLDVPDPDVGSAQHVKVHLARHDDFRGIIKGEGWHDLTVNFDEEITGSVFKKVVVFTDVLGNVAAKLYLYIADLQEPGIIQDLLDVHLPVGRGGGTCVLGVGLVGYREQDEE